MKTILTLLLLLWLSATPSHALLGETVKELKRRYGVPIDADSAKQPRTDQYQFRWEFYIVTVIVHEGTSVSEEFAREDKREFSLQEVRHLLAEGSSPGSAWKQLDGSSWKQEDRAATWS